MAGPINSQSAIRGATMSDLPLRGGDSPGELLRARPIPVHSVLADHQDTSPLPPTSGEAPDLHHAQIRQVLPVSVSDETKNQRDAAQLQQRLLPLLQHGQAWTNKHLHHLKNMDNYCLEKLLPLLQHDQVWTTEHLPYLKKMDGYRLVHLLPLLQHDQAWTSEHWPHLKKLNGFQLECLLPLLQHDQAWTSKHLPHLKDMDDYLLEKLLPLLRHDRAWITEHWQHLKEMDGDRLEYLFPLLQFTKDWTPAHWRCINEMDLPDLRKLSRFIFLRIMNAASGNFYNATNPYVREALSIESQGMEEPARILQMHGASRSTFDPDRVIASYLTERFKNNYQKIPAATFGVENEMFIPGIPKVSYPQMEDELNEKLGTKTKRYQYVKDKSLVTEAHFATPPIEQVTSILNLPEDVQRLQNALSILNDWGGFINHTAGVHIHTGIKQWKAADCLNTLEEKNKNSFLSQWDQELSENFSTEINLPQCDLELFGNFHIAIKITPYQLLFIKQFLVNMIHIQNDFYVVSRKSTYSMPNGPEKGENLDKYCQDVSSARSYGELLSAANTTDRHFNVNLHAYQKHGTLEVRGFTKKNNTSMEVDPNMPVRDLVFMQEMLMKVLNETKKILLSGASPEDPINVRPSEGLTEMVKDYVQDIFLLEIIHALGQRQPEKRVKTMDALVKDKDLITSETLRKIRESQELLLEDDPLAQHFLAALNNDAPWNPVSGKKSPLKRTNSLRSMADASVLAESRSHKRPRLR